MNEDNKWKLRVLEQSKQTQEEWFNHKWLPEGVGEYCLNLAKTLDVPIPAVANTFIAAMHVACGCFTKVQVLNTWQEPIIFWGMIVAPPGMKKSPIMGNIESLFMDSVETIEKNYREAYKDFSEKLREYKTKLAKWQKDKNHLEMDKPERPEPPPPDMVIAHDFTFEALMKWMIHSPRLSAWQDEIAHLFANLNRYVKGGDNAQFLIKCFQAKQHNVIRVGTDDNSVFNQLRIDQSHLNIFGTIQPEILSNNMKTLIDSGIAARFSAFSTFIPNGVCSKAQQEDVNISSSWRMTAVFQKLYQIKPHHVLKVEKEGIKIVAGYKDSIKPSMSVDISGSLNKTETFIYRLAGVKSLWDFAASGGDPNQCIIVSAASCQWAVDYFDNVCMRNIFDFWRGAASDPDNFDMRIASIKRQILALNKKEISINEMRKAKVKGLLSSDTRSKYIDALVESGFMQEQPNNKFLILASE